jgi:hypothetical protein
MNILEILPTLGESRGTSKFEWQCWGEHAQYIDWGGEENHIASAVFDRTNGQIFCVELFTGAQAVRYFEPQFRDSYLAECQTRGIDIREAAPGLPYTDIEDPQVVIALVATLQESTANDPT